MESPFSEKGENPETNVFSAPLEVSERHEGASSSNNQELVNGTITEGNVSQSHNMMVISQEPRVAFPSIIANSHDQSTTQEGLENEIVVEMGPMYSSLETNSMSGVILPYGNQRLDGENNTHIEESETLKTDIDENDIGKKRLDNTLVGRIVEVLRSSKEPLSMEDILTSIGDSFDKLRKADGTKYKGDRTKAVNGALYSTGVFRRVNDKWSLRPAEYQVYESRMRQKLEHRGKKRRISEGTGEAGDRPVTKRKYTRKMLKRGTVVRMLKSLSSRLRTSTREQNVVFFKNPFQGLTGNEDLIKIRKKLGDEKFEMAIQMYNYFEDLLEKEGLESEDTIKTGNDEQTSQLLNQLQQEVYELKTRLGLLEKINYN
ncbi:hypothetical protein WA538_001169, partial [Blastocystis sp. DL]